MATKFSSRARTSKRSVRRPPTSSRPPAFEDSIRASSRTESTSRGRRGRHEVAEEKEPKAQAKEEAEEEAKEEVHEPRAKPKLEPHMKKLLALRFAKNAARPKFRRQEWFRYRKFGDEWRKPQGGQSKLRRHFGYRWNLPSIGYRGPRAVRGLHPSGFQEVLVHNERQLEGLDAAKQAVRIGHAVGSRKRELIEKACDEKGLRVLNRMVTE